MHASQAPFQCNFQNTHKLNLSAKKSLSTSSTTCSRPLKTASSHILSTSFPQDNNEINTNYCQPIGVVIFSLHISMHTPSIQTRHKRPIYWSLGEWNIYSQTNQYLSLKEKIASNIHPTCLHHGKGSLHFLQYLGVTS